MTALRIDKGKYTDAMEMRENQNRKNEPQTHTPMRETFKIYKKHHVDNHILFLHFFLPCKMKV